VEDRGGPTPPRSQSFGDARDPLECQTGDAGAGAADLAAPNAPSCDPDSSNMPTGKRARQPSAATSGSTGNALVPTSLMSYRPFQGIERAATDTARQTKARNGHTSALDDGPAWRWPAAADPPYGR